MIILKYLEKTFQDETFKNLNSNMIILKFKNLKKMVLDILI